MKVELLSSTDLLVADKAISKCWQQGCDNVEPNKKRMLRVANKNKHKSTIEHLVYTFDIDGVSRACLQEIVRHRIASYSIKSSRYTLGELKGEKSFISFDGSKREDMFISDEQFDRACKYLFMTENDEVNTFSVRALDNLRLLVQSGIDNDISKYAMPEAFKTSLVMTINARSLQNFLELRSSSAALSEIRDLAYAMYIRIPEEHKFLFDYVYEKNEDNEEYDGERL